MFLSLFMGVAQAAPSPVPAIGFDGPPPGAAAAGAAGAYTGLARGPEALFANPAGLEEISEGAAAFGLTFYFPKTGGASDADLNAEDPNPNRRIVQAVVAKQWIGGGWRSLSSRREESGSSALEYSAHEFSVAMARKSSDRMAWAFRISFLAARMAEEDNPPSGTARANIDSGFGLAVGWGLLWRLPAGMNFSLSADNAPAFVWWGDFDAQRPGAVLRPAIAWRSRVLSSSVEYERRWRRPGETDRWKLGLEEYAGPVTFRQGISVDSFSRFEKTAAEAAGIGWKIGGWRLDFAGQRFRTPAGRTGLAFWLDLGRSF